MGRGEKRSFLPPDLKPGQGYYANENLNNFLLLIFSWFQWNIMSINYINRNRAPPAIWISVLGPSNMLEKL